MSLGLPGYSLGLNLAMRFPILVPVLASGAILISPPVTLPKPPVLPTITLPAPPALPKVTLPPPPTLPTVHLTPIGL